MGRGEQGGVKKEAKVEKERKKVAASSTQMLADVEQNVSFKTWKHQQEEVDSLWEELCLEKYRVEESKISAYKGRGEPPDWRIVRRDKRYQPRKWSDKYWARNFTYGSENAACSDSQACRQVKQKRKE